MGVYGSDKSTLLHILGGVDKPTSGDVIIDDKSLKFLARRSWPFFVVVKSVLFISFTI